MRKEARFTRRILHKPANRVILSSAKNVASATWIAGSDLSYKSYHLLENDHADGSAWAAAAPSHSKISWWRFHNSFEWKLMERRDIYFVTIAIRACWGWRHFPKKRRSLYKVVCVGMWFKNNYVKMLVGCSGKIKRCENTFNTNTSRSDNKQHKATKVIYRTWAWLSPSI